MAGCSPLGGHPTGGSALTDLGGPGRSTRRIRVWCHRARSPKAACAARSRLKVRRPSQTPWLGLIERSPFSVWPLVDSRSASPPCGGARPKAPTTAPGSGRTTPAPGEGFLGAKDSPSGGGKRLARGWPSCVERTNWVSPQLDPRTDAGSGAARCSYINQRLLPRPPEATSWPPGLKGRPWLNSRVGRLQDGRAFAQGLHSRFGQRLRQHGEGAARRRHLLSGSGHRLGHG